MLLNRESSSTRWRTRPDGREKVTGQLSYLTDRIAPHMLIGRVLRSPHPHARILAINTENAERLPGVHAVLTYKDVPGMNGFGIAVQDQPVLCYDKVRYVGDAIAAVAAETARLAERALALIEVEYEVLPVVDDPSAALATDAPRLHAKGNVLHRAEFKRGDVEKGFMRCKHIVEETYHSSRQMHTYMETEGGLFVPEEEGRLTVYAPTQHGFMDRLQLSRITKLSEQTIRIVSSPIGGSFGGKDELNVQPYGALLALHTQRPVKLHNSRKESVRTGLKRHPMTIKMRTGIDEAGTILAHQVIITADTGAYATLGAEVLNFATEHVLGPYRYEHVDVRSVSVYTNNGMSGEFRGFGGNQALLALEGQMDRLAEMSGMDPWAFRLHNMRRADDPGPFGQPIAPTNGAQLVWDALAASPLWNEKLRQQHGGRTASEEQAADSRLRTGIGAAFIMHGAGLGAGIPDPAGGRLVLAEDGKIEAQFGYEECGQGLLATLELMMIEQFGFAAEDLRLVIGDTDAVPDSGSTTASRATTMMWQSLQQLRPSFERRVLEAAEAITGHPAEELRLGAGGVWQKLKQPEQQVGSTANDVELIISYKQLAASSQGTEQKIRVETKFAFPTTSFNRTGAHYLYTFAAVAVKVEVDTLTGRVHVLDQFHTIAAGPVMNPQGYLGQIEGGSIMALGYTLTEEALMQGGHYVTRNLDTYLIPTMKDASGRIAVQPIEQLAEGDHYGPRGIGEIGSVGLAPAILSAVHDATRKRLNQLPIDPHSLIERTRFA
ncbi:xanthine dehydrogenase subunit D [Paenibacillus sp. OV219]|uniref:xanthine dehydrogenase subunit D n=1 Tax=Paenibacillus sp. OV219 TaxID=1884377 RepID=UPI0008B6EEFF|nr:xanthine dehydrogenase subunit D [Paenibacillus sp. OV219]SEM86609.1 xanthine dehydrogenase, molybdenum binding subunit apoprotein [Paenibacillus sp. OV219]